MVKTKADMEREERVKRWAKGRNPNVVLFGIWGWLYAGYFREWLEILHRGDAVRYLGDPPPMKEWRSYYTERGSVLNAILKRIPPLVEGETAAKTIKGLVRSLDAVSVSEANDFVRLDPHSSDPRVKSVREFSEQIAAATLENLTVIATQVFPFRPLPVGHAPIPSDFQFLFRIVIPNWLLLGRSLFGSLEGARNGDGECLDVLFRLDSSLAQDPKIAEQMYKTFHGGQRHVHHQKTKGLSRQLAIGDAKTLKIMALGFTGLLSERAGERLNSPSLRELADALEAIRSQGKHLRDPALPAGTSALTKAIQRGKKDVDVLIKVESMNI